VSLVEQVTAYFTLDRSNEFFTLGDPVYGALGDYPLIGDTAYDVTPSSFRIQVTRGRSSRVSEDIAPGVASVAMFNMDRTFDPNYASSPYVGNVVPGKRVTLSTNYLPYFDGNVEDWNYSYDVNGMSVATMVVLDPLGSLARMEFDEWTTTSQHPGDRIAAVLDRGEVLFGANRVLDDGVFTLQADSVSWGSNVLNYLQLVARSDFGYLFATRQGLVKFKDRRSFANGMAPFVIGVDVPLHGIEAQYGSEALFNRVGVDREGGTQQTVTSPESVTAYGARSTSLTGLLLNSDTDSLSFAQFLLNRYKDPVWRVASVTVKLHALDSYQCQLIVGLDIGHLVGVQWTPNGVGSAVVTTCIVEGIDHDVAPGEHTVTLNLGDLDLVATLTLGDPVLGRLGSNALAF
jgi:hypothetical protein